jgi:hypothetical protein
VTVKKPPTNPMLGHILRADLGEDYDADAALNFLKALTEDKGSQPQTGKTKAQANLRSLLQNPPEEDTTLHVIYKTPYVIGEIVLAGTKTRRQGPLCDAHPIHFKKTYLQKMSRWETSPQHEAKQTQIIWEHFRESHPWKAGHARIPRPLGASPESFRSTLLEARSVGALSPINPHGDARETAEQISQAKLRENKDGIGKLWEGLEDLDLQADILHSGGILHRDLHRENLMLREANGKFEGCLIDFETAEEDERFNTPEWETACQEDKRHLRREAALIFLCGSEPEKKAILASGSALSQAIARDLKTDPFLLGIEKESRKQAPKMEERKQPKEMEGVPHL